MLKSNIFWVGRGGNAMKVPFILVVLILTIVSCQNKSDVIELDGNWQGFSNDSTYIELYFHDDTMEIFERIWELEPYSIYRVEGDQLILKGLTYQIVVLDSSSIKLKNKDINLDIQRLDSNLFTVEKLIDLGVYNGQNKRMDKDSISQNFVIKNFSVREVEAQIKKGIYNGDTLFQFWKNQLTEDSVNQDYYRFLIEEVDIN